MCQKYCVIRITSCNKANLGAILLLFMFLFIQKEFYCRKIRNLIIKN